MGFRRKAEASRMASALQAAGASRRNVRLQAAHACGRDGRCQAEPAMAEPIDHASDPRLGAYRLVGDHAALEREGLFVAEGRLVVERLLEDGRFSVHSVLVTPSALAALTRVLEQ